MDILTRVTRASARPRRLPGLRFVVARQAKRLSVFSVAPWLSSPWSPRLAMLCGRIERMSTADHRREAPASVAVHIITVSDTRTLETDTSGRAIADLLGGAGHVVHGRTILKDEPADVAAKVTALVADPAVDAVITTGGTGITSRDSTFEAVDGLLQKRLVGFGELFRMLSYQDIGAAAMLSRATAGLAGRTIVIALPGSEHAVRLGMEKLVLPELAHLVREARR